MTSKEAVLELICEAKSVNFDDERICFLRKLIEKDLEILEEHRKIEEELGFKIHPQIKEFLNTYWFRTLEAKMEVCGEKYLLH